MLGGRAPLGCAAVEELRHTYLNFYLPYAGHPSQWDETPKGTAVPKHTCGTSWAIRRVVDQTGVMMIEHDKVLTSH